MTGSGGVGEVADGGATLPRLPCAAIHGDVNGGVLHTRAAGVVRNAEGDLVGAGSELADGGEGNGGGGIQGGAHEGGVARHVGVIKKTGAGGDEIAGGKGDTLGVNRPGTDRVTGGAKLGPVNIGEEHADGRVGHRQTAGGIEGGEGPRGGAAHDINAGGDAEDKTTGGGEIKVTAERSEFAGEGDLDVTEGNIPEDKTALVERGVEGLHDAKLVNSGSGVCGVFKLDRVGKADVARDVIFDAGARGAYDADIVRALAGETEKIAQSGVLDLDGGLVKTEAGLNPEVLHMSLVRETEIKGTGGWQRIKVVILRRILAIPAANSGEERGPAAEGGDSLLIGVDAQQAGRDQRELTGNLGEKVDGRRLILSAELAGLAQAGEIHKTPLFGVGGCLD